MALQEVPCEKNGSHKLCQGSYWKNDSFLIFGYRWEGIGFTDAAKGVPWQKQLFSIDFARKHLSMMAEYLAVDLAVDPGSAAKWTLAVDFGGGS